VSLISRKDYLFHFRPRWVSAAAMRFTYTWGLGGIAATLILLLLVSGLMLKFVYVPTPEKAYDSVLDLQRSVMYGSLIRNTHHWSANLLVIVTFLHMLRTFFTGAFQGNRRLTWIVGVGLFATILLANFTGYLLPWDQLAYWAVTISTAALAYLPGIGSLLQALVIGGHELNPTTLSNFFVLHTAVLPMLLLVLLPFHFWRIRKAGGLAATGGGRIEAFPHLLVRETAMALAVTAAVLLMAALWDAPLGAEANPGLSPNPTKAPWYFAGLQELLLHLHPVVAVALIPPVSAVGIICLPFLPWRPASPGRWFDANNGARTVGAAALLALVTTPVWIVAYAQGFSQLTWLAPMLHLTLMVALVAVLSKRPGASAYHTVQAAVTFLVVTFLVLTLIGTWFRGSSMALVWPWQ
jgi:quinol-cytochrome oxidoreductase complex cytochrome b subunit